MNFILHFKTESSILIIYSYSHVSLSIPSNSYVMCLEDANF